jgi:hypothetical protein
MAGHGTDHGRTLGRGCRTSPGPAAQVAPPPGRVNFLAASSVAAGGPGVEVSLERNDGAIDRLGLPTHDAVLLVRAVCGALSDQGCAEADRVLGDLREPVKDFPAPSRKSKAASRPGAPASKRSHVQRPAEPGKRMIRLRGNNLPFPKGFFRQLDRAMMGLEVASLDDAEPGAAGALRRRLARAVECLTYEHVKPELVERVRRQAFMAAARVLMDQHFKHLALLRKVGGERLVNRFHQALHERGRDR